MGRGRPARRAPPYAVIIGVTLGAVVLVFGLVGLLSGPSKRRGTGRSGGRSGAARAPSSAEGAKQLKRQGMREMGKGRSCFMRAGNPDAPDRQRNFTKARKHLEVAQQFLERAKSGLPHDKDLQSLLFKCNQMLGVCRRMSAVDAH